MFFPFLEKACPLIITFSLYPKEPQARAQVDFLLNWDLGDLYASIMKSLYPTLGFRPMPADLEAEKKNYQAKLQFMNDHLIKVRTSKYFLRSPKIFRRAQEALTVKLTS